MKLSQRARSKEKHQQWFHALASVLPSNDRRLSIDNNLSCNFLQLQHRKSEVRWLNYSIGVTEISLPLERSIAGNFFYSVQRRKKDRSLEARRKRNLTDIPTSRPISSEKSNDDSAEIESVDARVSSSEVDLRKNIEISEIENGNMLDQLKKFYSRNKKNFAYRFSASTRMKSDENDFQMRKYSSCHSITNAIIESTSSSIRKKSLSCECIVTVESAHESHTSRKPRVNDINEEEPSHAVINDQPEPDQVAQVGEKSTKKISNRIHKNTISRRSFNFFRKILTKGKPSKECASDDTDERVSWKTEIIIFLSQAVCTFAIFFQNTPHPDEKIIDSKTLVSFVHVEESPLDEISDDQTSAYSIFFALR